MLIDVYSYVLCKQPCHLRNWTAHTLKCGMDFVTSKNFIFLFVKCGSACVSSNFLRGINENLFWGVTP